MSGPAGEIYRLKASVGAPSCAATSPQAAILITVFRNYGLTLSGFEPVNVSSLIVSNSSGVTSH